MRSFKTCYVSRVTDYESRTVQFQRQSPVAQHAFPTSPPHLFDDLAQTSMPGWALASKNLPAFVWFDRMNIAKAFAVQEETFGFSGFSGRRDGAHAVLDVLRTAGGDKIRLRKASVARCQGNLFRHKPSGFAATALLTPFAIAACAFG